jgi:hypothetical protein
MNGASETFWTVKDGTIGTAHTSRDGELVDFRPAKNFGVNNNISELVHGQPNCEVKWYVYAFAAKGVQIKCLTLSAAPIKWEIDPEGQTPFLLSSEVIATFEGVEIKLPVPSSVWYRVDPNRKNQESEALYLRKELDRSLAR